MLVQPRARDWRAYNSGSPKRRIELRTLLAVGLAALCIETAGAESQLGVEVYPGARPAPEVARVLKEQMRLTVMTYTTSDSVEKVTAFYRKQPLKESAGADKEGATFSGKAVMVTVQNPWLDMKTGKVNTDTLLSIGKK